MDFELDLKTKPEGAIYIPAQNIHELINLPGLI